MKERKRFKYTPMRVITKFSNQMCNKCSQKSRLKIVQRKDFANEKIMFDIFERLNKFITSIIL